MLDQKTTFQVANQRYKEGPKYGLYAGLDIGGTNVVVGLVPMEGGEPQDLAKYADCIVDTRNAMAGIETRPGQVWKA